VTRTRSLGTKVTEDEYQRALTAAGAKPTSEWVREVVLAHLDRRPLEHVLLEELVVLRIYFLNAVQAARSGEPMTYEAAEGHITRAEAVKADRARALLDGAR